MKVLPVSISIRALIFDVNIALFAQLGSELDCPDYSVIEIRRLGSNCFGFGKQIIELEPS